MMQSPVEVAASTVHVTYDSTQHAMVIQRPQGNVTAMDACPATGGYAEEFSPTNLVASGLAGCMLFSMGVVALRDGIDLSGTEVDVGVSPAVEPFSYLGPIRLIFTMPRALSRAERAKLERAAEACPIHNSFRAEVPIIAEFTYPD